MGHLQIVGSAGGVLQGWRCRRIATRAGSSRSRRSRPGSSSISETC